MKLSGIAGTGTGKVGNLVFSTAAGQQIVRQYQPNVSNPNSLAQVNQRAKLKLMSQIAAALAPVIVIPKEGLKSSRNLFIKKNIGSAMAEEGVAQITYENVQLTNGNSGIPAIHVMRSANSGCQINLDERCDAAVSRVVYIMYRKTSEATLQYVQSVIAESAGPSGDFPATMLYVEGDLVFFAYGMKDLNSKASAQYSNYNVQNAEDIAKLSMSRTINYGDYQFTQTRGCTLFAGESENVTVGANQARVYVTALGNGTVNGAGVFDLASQVTVTATPASGQRFMGWKLNGGENYVSTNASYTFTLEGTTDLVAVFAEIDASETYTVTLQQPGNADAGTATMTPSNGVVAAGSAIQLDAGTSPTGLADFRSWQMTPAGGSPVTIGNTAQLTYTPQGDCTITPIWESSIGEGD